MEKSKKIEEKIDHSSDGADNNSIPELKIVSYIKIHICTKDFCFLKDEKFALLSLHTAYIYDFSTYKLCSSIDFPFEDDIITVFSALKDGGLAFGSEKGEIAIWKQKNGSLQCVHFKKKRNGSWMTDLIELEDGKLCSSFEKGEIEIFDNKNNYEIIKRIEGHGDIIYWLTEIDDYIISSDCKDVKIWKKSIYQCITTIKGIYEIAYGSFKKYKDNMIIFGGENKIFFTDPLFFQVKSIEDEKFGFIGSIYVIREDKILLGNDQGMIFGFNPLTKKIIFTQKVHNKFIDYIDISEQNELISFSYRDTVNFYGKYF